MRGFFICIAGFLILIISLSFLVFNVQRSDDPALTVSHSAGLEELRSTEGMKIVPHRVCSTDQEIMDVLGAEYDPDSAGLFIFGKLPDPVLVREGKTPGEELSDALLYEAGIFITPGFIFGHNGDNYIRISLCAPVSELEKALEKTIRWKRNEQ